MKIDGIIKVACLAWYKDDEDNIVILTEYKEKVLLNKLLSTIWETIYTVKDKNICIELLQGIASVEKIQSCLNYFEDNELIKIYESDRIFDVLFA